MAVYRLIHSSQGITSYIGDKNNCHMEMDLYSLLTCK